MQPELREQAKNRWPSILSLLGVEKQYLRNKQGPCPTCAGRDRYRFDDKGTGMFFCNACGAGDGVKLLQLVHGWDFETVAREVRGCLDLTTEAKARPKMDDDKRRGLVKAMWDKARPVSDGDEVSKYFAGRNLLGPYPSALRTMTNARVDVDGEAKFFTAMLAKVCDPEGKPYTLHRTFLQDGGKAPIESPRRMMAGDTPLGSHIRLGTPHDGILGVAEGIETALACRLAFGVVTWATISAGGMSAFVLPEGIKEIRIYNDCDHNYCGQAAAYTLAHRLSVMKDGPVVHVSGPGIMGKDWADFRHDVK